VASVVFARCAGAPRDVGADQGRAARERIRADVRALTGAAGGVVAGLRAAVRALAGAHDRAAEATLARDLRRHFPHLDERLAGLAAGAGVPAAALLALLAHEAESTLFGVVRWVLPDVDAGPAPTGRLALALMEPLPATGLVARETHPDGGYRSLGVTRPGQIGALAGVNERGLAGAVAIGRSAGGATRCAAPGFLLLDQCLERLDSVEKALEWCERRPGEGRALLVFADAQGASGAIGIDGEKRSRCAPPAGPLPDTRGPQLVVDPVARTLRGAAGAALEACLVPPPDAPQSPSDADPPSLRR
jgi:hypothetical protein